MKRLAFILSSLLLAAASDPRAIRSPVTTLVNNLGLDAARAFSATPCDAQGNCYSTLVLTLSHGTHNSATAIAMSCTESPDATINATLQECDVAAGACTSSNASWSKAIAGVAAWSWRVDIKGYISVACTITDTGGDGSDKITVVGYMISE